MLLLCSDVCLLGNEQAKGENKTLLYLIFINIHPSVGQARYHPSLGVNFTR